MNQCPGAPTKPPLPLPAHVLLFHVHRSWPEKSSPPENLLVQPELPQCPKAAPERNFSHHTAASRPATAWWESFGGALRKNTQKRYLFGAALGQLWGTGATLAEPEVFGAAFFRPTAEAAVKRSLARLLPCRTVSRCGKCLVWHHAMPAAG